MENRKRIIISRPVSEDSALAQFCRENNIELKAESFIEMNVVPDIVFPDTDWIFFSSPTAVKFYFENYTLNNQKIAVMGAGTGRALKEFSLNVDYLGEKGKQPAQIGKEFGAQLLEGETVLFPVSNLSRKSISSQLQDHQKKEIVFYNTEILKKDVGYGFDLAILTSPSNVSGFLNSSYVNVGSFHLVLGETTKEFLEEEYHEKNVIDVGTSEEDWIAKIKELIL